MLHAEFPGTDIQVSRLDGSRSIINILQQREYYMFEGDGITFKCICSNQGWENAIKIKIIFHTGRSMLDSTTSVYMACQSASG